MSIEVAGSDVNPYMLISSIVLGVNEGIEKQTEPPNPEVGNAYKSNNDGLPRKLAGINK